MNDKTVERRLSFDLILTKSFKCSLRKYLQLAVNKKLGHTKGIQRLRQRIQTLITSEPDKIFN
jgi:hypothetical protein